MILRVSRWPPAGKASAAVRGMERVGSALWRWSDDRCSSMSAALAFYAAFSLAPMLVIVTAVASFFFGEAAAQGRIYAGFASLVGKEGATVVQSMMASAWKSGQGGWAGWLSLVAIVIGASATFSELHRAINIIWRTRPEEHVVATMIRVRLTSFGLVVGTGFLIVVLLVADTAITFATEVALYGTFIHPLVGLVQHALSFGFLCLAFTVLLKVLPDTTVRWRAAAVGGFAAAFLFSGGKHLFALYLAHAGTANAFGAASALAVMMMWFFFSAAVFLLGAELAAPFSNRPGRPPTPGRSADEPRTMPWLLR